MADDLALVEPEQELAFEEHLETLKDHERAFVDYFLADPNSKRAFEQAYPDRKGGECRPYKIRWKPDVARAIAMGQKIATARAGISCEYVLNGLKTNLERSMRAYPVLNKDGEPTGEYVYDGAAANKALELMGKYLKMWDDRQQMTLGEGITSVIIEVNTSTEPRRDLPPELLIEPLETDMLPAHGHYDFESLT